MYLTKSVPVAYARQFEIRASAIINNIKNIKTASDIYKFTNHCVLEGYWNKKAYNWCKKNNIQLTFKTYKKPKLMHSIYKTVKALIFHIVLFWLPSLYKIYSKKKYE